MSVERVNPPWELNRKHIFILTSSGKPVFTKHGDEQELVTIFGLLQAVVSIVNDSGDNIRCIKTTNRRKILYFIRKALYFIIVSSVGENEAVLQQQLEFMYSQILLILTTKVHDVLKSNSSKDLRDLLGPETNRWLQSSCSQDIVPTQIAFSSLKSYHLPYDLRNDITNLLRNCVDSSRTACGLLLQEEKLISLYSPDITLDTSGEISSLTSYCTFTFIKHLVDYLLLCHFVANATSLSSHDQNWVPICLPNFNSTAYLQAYICKMKITDSSKKSIEIFLVLIATTSDPSTFIGLHENRAILEKELNSESIAQGLVKSLDNQNALVSKHQSIVNCLHFYYKFRQLISREVTAMPTQSTESEFQYTLHSKDSQERIWTAYQRLSVCMRIGSSSVENSLTSNVISNNIITNNNTSNKSNKNISFSNNRVDGDNDYDDYNVLNIIPGPDHALNYVVLNNGIVVVGLATSDSELYVTYPGTISPLDACGSASYLSKNLKSEAFQLFMTSETSK